MNDRTDISLASKVGPGSLISTLLLAGVLFLGPDWRAHAQFPAAPGDEPTASIGVFQLTVDPAFAFLFGPHPTYYYPGYSPTSGILTSTPMYDFSDTSIGVSASHVRSATPLYFPVTVGTGAEADFPDSIAGYSSYAVIPPGFSFPAEPYGKDEIMTEIESFNLKTTIGSSTGLQCTNDLVDSRVPQVFTNVSVVVAGNDIPNLAPTQRSIGMVQEVGAGDFSPTPAQSFFNIYVEVTLPISVGDNSAYDFPPFSGNPVPPGYQPGAVLYNDYNDPLVITNLDVTSLPPQPVYIHGVTTAVPMKFKFANPPYWAANDVIGYLVLAGHGLITNSNDCAQIAVATSNVLDRALGPVGAPKDQMAIPWLRGADDSFPSMNSSYVSVANTVTSGSGTSVLDDTVSFVLPGGQTNYVRDLVLTGISNSISPPPTAGSSSTYSANQTVLSFQLSTNGGGGGFTQETSSPGSLQLAITNTGTLGSTVTFATGILQLSNSVTSIFGTMYVRQSPTIPSLGSHTIAPDPRGFRVSSVFNANLEFSRDGVTWVPSTKYVRLQAGMPPAAPGSIFITLKGNQVELNWQNNFTLQSATDVTGPYTDVSGGASGPVTTGPYFDPIVTRTKFYRLISQ
jgi:hypothetical protein